jgi:spore coat assembly protein
MCNFKVGDIVARKSYGSDILFKVVDIIEIDDSVTLILKGIAYRIEADAPENDLILQSDLNVSNHNLGQKRAIDRKCWEIETFNSMRGLKKLVFRSTPNDNSRTFARPGKVLHIDGDSEYLDNCLNHYEKLGIEAVGKYIPENAQPSSVYKLLEEHKPDILVLTGHDGYIRGEDSYSNIKNYRTSVFFVQSVKEARKYEPDLDNLAIFAGACQSMYSELLKAGANYASSPRRVLIHALDPVFVCQKIAFTGIDKIVSPVEVINSTITGADGIGGLQTRGKYRNGFPLEPYGK